MQDQLPRFSSFQDWYDFLDSRTEGDGDTVNLNGNELLAARRACYRDIQNLRHRPLLVYSTYFTGSLPDGAPVSIDLNDIDGFTDLIASVPANEREIDILIHSPGGSPDSTERIVNLLRARFDEVHFLVPHSAYSAATMLAMAGNTITLHPSAVLGPIDPQINGIPARQIKRSFENLNKKVLTEGQQSIFVYLPLIEKYSLHLLEMCDDSEKLSTSLVKLWLKTYMFNGSTDHRTLRNIRNATNYMANFDKHLLHSRPLETQRLKSYGLKIAISNRQLSRLLWEAHVLLDGLSSISGFVKVFESDSLSWGKRPPI